MPVYQFPDGTLSQDPIGLTAAKAAKSRTYAQAERCTAEVSDDGFKCGCRYRYTASGKCLHCAQRESLEFRGFVVGLLHIVEGPSIEWLTDGVNTDRPIEPEQVQMFARLSHIFSGSTPALSKADALDSVLGVYIDTAPCKTAGHVGVYYPDGKCLVCDMERTVLNPRKVAKASGQDMYLSALPCEKCGGSEFDTSTGTCSACSNKLSPRAQAVKDGAIWYTPDTRCKRCGTLSERRVNNGACRGCDSKDTK